MKKILYSHFAENLTKTKKSNEINKQKKKRVKMTNYLEEGEEWSRKDHINALGKSIRFVVDLYYISDQARPKHNNRDRSNHL